MVQTGFGALSTRMIELDLRKSDRDASESSALTTTEASRVRARPAAYVGAVVTLLRLMFSQRARTELSNSRRELEYALNEVDARLARMHAEARGERVLLRLVSGLAPSSRFSTAGTACPSSEQSGP
jgi:hypothetical protein